MQRYSYLKISGTFRVTVDAVDIEQAHIADKTLFMHAPQVLAKMLAEEKDGFKRMKSTLWDSGYGLEFHKATLIDGDDIWGVFYNIIDNEKDAV